MTILNKNNRMLGIFIPEIVYYNLAVLSELPCDPMCCTLCKFKDMILFHIAFLSLILDNLYHFMHTTCC